MSTTLPFAADDPRWLAFRSPHGPEVFHSLVSTHDIWRADPFDVETIHVPARDAFAQTVARINNADPILPGAGDAGGKMFLLRGESGAGKTHLLRAFRHHLHSRGLGWFVYLQMTTSISHYPRYILRNLVESFSQPYELSQGVDETGWLRLSNFLVEHPSVPADLRTELREGEANNCPELVFRVTEHLLDTPHFARADVHEDLIRTLLFFQRREPAFARRALAFLRCDHLTDYDRGYLGGLAPRTADEDPLDMLVQIGRLANLFERQALVVAVDQLEDIWISNAHAPEQFRNALGALRALTDKTPGALAVIACLEDYYAQCRSLIAAHQSLLDRLEKEAPEPVVLETQRTPAEVRELVARRLDALFQSQGATFRPEEPTFPFPDAEIAKLDRFRPRAVLLNCRRAREGSIRTSEPPRIGDPVPSNPAPSAATDPASAPAAAVEPAWNDFRSNPALPAAPDDPENLASLLAWAVGAINAELGRDDADGFTARANRTFVEIETPLIPDEPRRWLVGVCNAAAPGGKLSGQVAELAAAARGATSVRAAIAVRSTAFPGKSPTSQIGKQLAEMIKGGGRRAVVEVAEWQTIHALREFCAKPADPAALAAWRAAERPLSRLPGLVELLRVDRLPRAERVPAAELPATPPATAAENVAPPPPPPSAEPPAPADVPSGPLTLGRTREAVPKPVRLASNELTRHAAFLGGSGSGKTTAALALIEGLLLRGVPAVLLDRKGDLACYARPESWQPAPGESSDAAARRERLRATVDVRLYTPGASGGRPLGISLLPRGAGVLPGPERESAARAAAASLGAMMNYRTAATAPRLAVLSRAIETLAELEPDAELTVGRLVDFIANEDDSLVNAIGHLETKLFKKLLQDLATFQVVKGHLLAPGDERVQAERLFGVGGDPAPPGKTRLSIISTKGFDDTSAALFWTAQFLLEVGRFAAKHPSTELQGVVLFDEADLYLPAVGKPVTKEPMENALRRWRSAGLGVLLSSQSPGDFDYKCRENVRTWFVGRVKEDTALNKMRPMLREAKTDIAARLPGLEAGQFFVVREGQVESLAAERCLVRAEQLPDAEILRLAAGGV